MKFTSVKQVKEALWRHRVQLAAKYANPDYEHPAIFAETMDGNYGRIYHLALFSNIQGRVLTIRPFEEFSTWVQGGLNRAELLAWANENLA